jgi:KDO2-lipid IV(A) lauroyltransferase
VVLKKLSFRNTELLEELLGKRKQIMVVSAHYGNWEYLTTLGLLMDYPFLAIYKTLKNYHFDSMVKKNRTRLGATPVPMEKIARKLISFHQDQKPVMTLFLSDQRPLFKNIQYWTHFLGMETPLYLGTEKLARKLDAAVVFVMVRKVKRGRYELVVELICENPSELDPYEITEKHVRILENQIREAPEYWLWSHRRWKHSYAKYKRLKGI